jgi:DNA-binding NarL/FixJ family response regulator
MDSTDARSDATVHRSALADDCRDDPWNLFKNSRHAMKVALVDDHELFRAGIRHILEATPDCQLVGEASTARDALSMIETARPDVVLMDIALPGMDGVVATREVRRRVPSTRVLILSAHDQTHDVLDALDAGATGYALKSDGPDALLEALRATAQGERYLAPSVAGRLDAHKARRRVGSDVLGVLSEREREIFRLAAECLMTREIAAELCISRKTVDTHLYRIHRKLGLRTSAELVRLAASLGMVHAAQTREQAVRALSLDSVPGTAAPATVTAGATTTTAAVAAAATAAVAAAGDADGAAAATAAVEKGGAIVDRRVAAPPPRVVGADGPR